MNTEKGITLNLVLTHHWFDEIAAGRKRIEYREIKPHWTRLIWDRRDKITHVKFQRAYNNTAPEIIYRVTFIDKGMCPYTGWTGKFYFITFTEEE